MNIVQLCTGLAPGGAERIALHLAVGMRMAGHEVSAISLLPTDPRSPIVTGLRKASIPVHSLDIRKRRPWEVRRLASLLDSLAPDVVHAHLFHANLAARWYGHRTGAKVINTIHDVDRRPNTRWRFQLDGLTAGGCDQFVAVSRTARDHYARLTGIAPERIAIVPDGIEVPPTPDPERVAALRRDWGVGECRRVLGSAGRLEPEKGFDRLLGLLPAISHRIPKGESWGLVVLGEGTERASLEALANRSPENLVVRLPGFRADAAECLGAFDLFLCPSRSEGFGLSVVEAMAHGIPVLLSDVDSLPELVEEYPPGRTLSFEPADLGRVTEAVTSMLLDPPSRFPSTPFTVREMLDRYTAIYRTLLAAD